MTTPTTDDWTQSMTTTPTPTIYRSVHVKATEDNFGLDYLLLGTMRGSILSHYEQGSTVRDGRDMYGRRVYPATPELDAVYGLSADPAEAAREREERGIACVRRRITSRTITVANATSADPAVVRRAAVAALAAVRQGYFTNAAELPLWDDLGLTVDGQLHCHPLLPAAAAAELRRQADALRDLPLGLAAPAVEGLWTELAEGAGIRTLTDAGVHVGIPGGGRCAQSPLAGLLDGEVAA